MKVVPFKREFAWPEPSSIVHFDPDIPPEWSRLQLLHQAVYDAAELEQLADMRFIVPRQTAAN